MKEGYHKTKSGKVAKKGLYYYMNRAKKKAHQILNLNQQLTLNNMLKQNLGFLNLECNNGS
jgi:hypothetical protein